MLNRQDSSLSASRRQATATPPPEAHRAKPVGCIPGIFHLLSKYQNPNKRLTFGKRQEKSSKPKSLPKLKSDQKQNLGDNNIPSTCDVIKFPRSPTLPAELRRSTDATPPTKSPRTPPSSSLITRLMGLNDVTEEKSQTAHNHYQETVNDHCSIKEKRQKLLEALEKCNHDLEALKRIVMALQSADVAAAKSGGSTTVVRPCMGVACTGQVSTSTGLKSVLQQPKPVTLAKKPGEDEQAIDKLFKNPTLLLLAKNSSLSSLTSRRTPPRCSTTMVRTIDEVCKDIAWGEKRETNRLGLVLQDYVCKDLIEELVKDLEEKSRCYMHCSSSVVLPHEACKRRLRF